MSQTLVVPLMVTLGKRKFHNYWLTMNNYRNWMGIVSNNIKVAFKASLDLSHLTPIIGPVHIHYTFYYPNLAHRDIGNSLAVIDKFTADALVEANIIPDDNYTIVQSISAEFGGIDRDNPRCLVTITQKEQI